MTIRTHSPRQVYRKSHVLEAPVAVGRTRSCSPEVAGSVWSPGGSVAKRLAVSFEAPCRARNFWFVAKVWPVYPK